LGHPSLGDIGYTYIQTTAINAFRVIASLESDRPAYCPQRNQPFGGGCEISCRCEVFLMSPLNVLDQGSVQYSVFHLST
jgi:hypothetical protein